MTLLSRVACVGVLLSGCSVFEEGLIDPAKVTSHPHDAGADAAGMNPSDGGDAAIICPGTAEICNGKDDDCDGVVDETKATLADCNTKRPHAVAGCANSTCFWSTCDPGFDDADGDKKNGCEAKCANASCDDAGSDDGGADDGG